MPKLQVALYRFRSNAAFARDQKPLELVADLSSRLSECQWSVGRKGSLALTAAVDRLSLGEQLAIYEPDAILICLVTGGGYTHWAGRVENTRVGYPGAFRFQAFGFYRALSDTLYTALWSKTRTDDWRPITPQMSSAYRPDRWEIDNNNRLYIAPRENEYYDITDDRGGLTFADPHLGARNIAVVTFDYTVTLPSATWVARLLSYTDAWGGVTVEWSQSGSGSGSATVTLTSPNPRLAFELFYNSAVETQWTGARTGSAFMRITNLRIKTTTSASVYADEIARALADAVSTVNLYYLLPESALIQSPAIDLRDESYEDTAPAQILDYLAFLGDAQNRRWEWGVTTEGMLYFQPRNTEARVWFIDEGALSVERDLDSLANSAYATYQESSGRTLRTADNTDATSINRWRVTRERAVRSSTTNSAQAATHRDAMLTDKRDPRVLGAVTVSQVFDPYGTPAPPYYVRPGDTLIRRNLGAQGSLADRIRSFTVGELTYSPLTRLATIAPDAPDDTLAVLLARQQEGIGLDALPRR